MSGLIIKNKIAQLRKGYPTISDKYNVKGGILTGDTAVEVGQLLKRTGTTGYYLPVNGTNTISALTDIAGIALAVNVKLINEWPGNGPVKTQPNEALDVCFWGGVALALDVSFTTDEEGSTTNRDAALALLAEGLPCYATSTGAFTTASSSNFKIGNFVGQYDILSESVVTTTTTLKVLANVFVNIEI